MKTRDKIQIKLEQFPSILSWITANKALTKFLDKYVKDLVNWNPFRFNSKKGQEWIEKHIDTIDAKFIISRLLDVLIKRDHH